MRLSAHRLARGWDDSPGCMARIVFGVLLFLAVFAQGTIVPRVNPLAVSPDLVLVLLFCWSARRSLREGLIWAFAVGLVVDSLVLDPLGANALALLPVVLLGLLSRRRVVVSTVVVPVVLVVIATIMHAVVLGAIRHTALDLKVVLVQSLMHAVLVPVLYLVFNAIDPDALQEAGR